MTVVWFGGNERKVSNQDWMEQKNFLH